MSHIPKIIHYCWFGGKEMSKLEIKCIKSWKEILPDYEIMEWNEKNFDIYCNNFAKEAYETKKWAFVSDYARLNILYKYGGVYMDTDVEVIKKIDFFLDHKAFIGFENETHLSTAIIGAKRKSKWIGLLLSDYNNRHFIKKDKSYDMIPNPVLVTKITKEIYNIKLNNSFQIFGDGGAIYPRDYFCPKNLETGKIQKTNNTYAIHHFNASWWSKEEHKLFTITKLVRKIFGKRIGKVLVSLLLLTREKGFIQTLGTIIKKILQKMT